MAAHATPVLEQNAAARGSPSGVREAAGWTSFGQLLDSHLRERGRGRRMLAMAVGITTGQVCNIIAGRRLPPLGCVEVWADLLALRGGDRDRFILAAHIAHCPPLIRDILAQAMEAACARDGADGADASGKPAVLRTLSERLRAMRGH